MSKLWRGGKAINPTTTSLGGDDAFFTQLVRETTARALGLTENEVKNLICGQCGHRESFHKVSGCDHPRCSCGAFLRTGPHDGEVMVQVRILALPQFVQGTFVIKVDLMALGTPAINTFIQDCHGYVEVDPDGRGRITVEGEQMYLRARPVWAGYWDFRPDPDVTILEIDNPPVEFAGRLMTRNRALELIAAASA